MTSTPTPTVAAERTATAGGKQDKGERSPRPQSPGAAEISSAKGSAMIDQMASMEPRSLRSWPQDALRVGFGAIWAIDAVLKWLPGFRSTYVAAITGVAKGQPGWLKWWFDFWVKLQTPRPTFFAPKTDDWHSECITQPWYVNFAYLRLLTTG